MELTNAKRMIVHECESALNSIDDRQGEALMHAILSAEKVYFFGVGRVYLSLQSICKRMAHLGINAHCVGEITEPALTPRDLLIIASGSGESICPKAVAQKAKALGAKLAWIGSNDDSTIACLSDVRVRIPVQTKLNLSDELHSQQPMTSLFEQCLLLYGDALAMEIMHRKNIDLDKLWRYHANLE